MAEQFAQRGGVELIDPLKFLRMNATGDEQAIDSEAMGPGQIGAYRISDGQNAIELDRVMLPRGGKFHGSFIDRPVRLAVKDHLAAKFTIKFGEGSRAIDQAVSSFHHDVGI